MQLNEGLCVQDGKELFCIEGNTVVDVQIRHGLLHGSTAEPLSVGLARISHHLLELGQSSEGLVRAIPSLTPSGSRSVEKSARSRYWLS